MQVKQTSKLAASKMSAPKCARWKPTSEIKSRSRWKAHLFMQLGAELLVGALVSLSVVGKLARADDQFTCGKLYYRTFHLDQQRNVLYVGAM